MSIQIQREGRKRRTDGFTLMEVALAVVVVGIGVLALFALISGGLDSSSKAVADTQAAFFADAVFNGLRAKAQEAAQNGTWNTFLSNPRALGLRPAAFPVWVDGVNMLITTANGGGIAVFKNQSLRTGSDTGVENFALRYKLSVVQTTRGPTDRKTYAATLWILPGQYPAPTWNDRDKSDAIMLYSEFPNMGSL